MGSAAGHLLEVGEGGIIMKYVVMRYVVMKYVVKVNAGILPISTHATTSTHSCRCKNTAGCISALDT